jgi:hypothetical protein
MHSCHCPQQQTLPLPGLSGVPAALQPCRSSVLRLTSAASPVSCPGLHMRTGRIGAGAAASSTFSLKCKYRKHFSFVSVYASARVFITSLHVTGSRWGTAMQPAQQQRRPQQFVAALPDAAVTAQSQAQQLFELSEGLETPVQLIYLLTLLGFLVVGAYLVVRQVRGTCTVASESANQHCGAATLHCTCVAPSVQMHRKLSAHWRVAQVLPDTILASSAAGAHQERPRGVSQGAGRASAQRLRRQRGAPLQCQEQQLAKRTVQMPVFQ